MNKYNSLLNLLDALGLYTIIFCANASITMLKTPVCEVDIPEPVYSGNEIGVHYGVKSLITDSNANSVKSPKYL